MTTTKTKKAWAMTYHDYRVSREAGDTGYWITRPNGQRMVGKAPSLKVALEWVEEDQGKIMSTVRDALEQTGSHEAAKMTGLWLVGLKPLVPSGPRIRGRMVGGKERWANQTDSGQCRLGPSEARAMERSRTYEGIARAMADQFPRQ